MREFTIFRRKWWTRGNMPTFKWGRSYLPFTQEVRHYIYLGPIGIDWWTGPKAVKPGIFQDT